MRRINVLLNEKRLFEQYTQEMAKWAHADIAGIPNFRVKGPNAVNVPVDRALVPLDMIPFVVQVTTHRAQAAYTPIGVLAEAMMLGALATGYVPVALHKLVDSLLRQEAKGMDLYRTENLECLDPDIILDHKIRDRRLKALYARCFDGDIRPHLDSPVLWGARGTV